MLLTLIVWVFIIGIAWRLFKGLVRTVLLVLAVTFVVLFLMQPTSVAPALMAHTAVHDIAQCGQAVSRLVLPRWHLWWDEMRHWL